MVLVMPPPLIVTVPDLDEVELFMVAESVMVWSPSPDDGVADNQDAFDDMDQGTVAVTFAAIDAASADGTIHEPISTDNDAVGGPCCAPGCETVMVLVMPPPLIVKTPDLDEVVLFASAESVMVWLPLPDDGVADNQDVLDEIDQATLAVT